MDLSSIDHSSDSGAGSDDDGDESIAVAVPVEAVIAGPSHDDVESEVEGDEGDEGEGGDAGGHDAASDAAGGDGEMHCSAATGATPRPPSPSSKKRSNSEMSGDDASSAVTDSAKKKKYNDGQPREPAAQGLTIPFRTIKRIMKLEKDIGIIQNEAAIMVTAALEQFVVEFGVKSYEIAARKGRNTIKYDDVAEARANDRSLSFLDMLIP